MRVSELFEEPIRLQLSGPSPKVKAFIKKMYDKYEESPMNPHQHVIYLNKEAGKQELALFELVPSPHKKLGDAVELKWIQAYPQRSGVGGKALKIIQDAAREAGIKLSLFPTDQGAISQTKLIKFYKKYGFKMMGGPRKDMHWEPEDAA